jgi:hypothetical protein
MQIEIMQMNKKFLFKTVQGVSGVLRGHSTPPPPPNSKVLKKLSQISSSVENTSITN